jgi:hypothetical protein
MHVKSSAMIAAELRLAAAELYTPWPSSRWREYFRCNAANLMRIPWELGVPLTDAEREAIGPSLQQFQLGESSDGQRFFQLAREYAAASGDAQYFPALRHFIAEEQRHGRDLGRVLDLARIPRIESCWADTLFRWLRHRAGLELSISVLVTAEIIAQVYYAALRDATSSRALRRLCDQILRDEDEHVRFQCERLAILRRHRSRPVLFVKRILQRFFFTGTCCVFWLKHRRAMRAGGYGAIAFGRSARRHFRSAIHLMDPRRYRFAKEASAPAAKAPERSPEPADLDLSGKWLEL